MSMVQTKKLSDKVVARAAMLAFAAKACEKDYSRDDLPDGSEFPITLTILATVDGEDYRHDVGGKLSVGHSSTRAGSVDAAEFVAWILGHVPADVQQAILADAINVYTESDGKFPGVEKANYDAVAKTLSAMRARNQTTVRGSVSVKIDKPHLSVVG